jgi:hypothetical protein
MAKKGRPLATIDLKELEKLCALQCTDEEIAAFFSVSRQTIERKKKNPEFKDAMVCGKAKGKVSVRRGLFAQMQKGGSGATAAAIFLAKNLLGYRDVNSTELSGPDGGPISLDQQKLASLSDDELIQLREIARKLAVPSSNGSGDSTTGAK